MQLSQWLRDELWAARDWAQRLVALANAQRAAPLERSEADRALALGEAAEAIVPSRSTAIEMYVTAWKAGQSHPQALARARYLCREIGNLALAAKIARLEYKDSQNPEYQLLEGLAWLDAQNPDRALRPLLAATKAMPGDPAVARALAIARREWTDVRGRISALEAMAAQTADPSAAAQLLLDAARVAGMIATDDTYQRLLVAAFHKNPLDQSIHDLLMLQLGQAGDYSRLQDLVDLWAAAAGSAQQRVEVYRRVGLDENLMNAKPELAVRMVYEALRIAYRHALPVIPGHLAMAGRLRMVLERTANVERFMSVLRIGIGREQSELERLWFAVNGLDVAWNQLERAEEALPFAKIVQDMAPTHSVLQDYRSGGGWALAEAASGILAASVAPVPVEPPIPTSSFEQPDPISIPIPPAAAPLDPVVLGGPAHPEPSSIPMPQSAAPIAPVAAELSPSHGFLSASVDLPPPVAAPPTELDVPGHLIPDPSVIDLSEVGGGSAPSFALPTPPTASARDASSPLPPAIDLPPPPPSSSPSIDPSAIDLVPSAPASESAANGGPDHGFLFEPVPPPLPPPAAVDDEMMLDDDDVMMLDDDDVEAVVEDVPLPVAPPPAVPAPPPPVVPAPPARRKLDSSEGAGPPPPPKFGIPGFGPPAKIPSIPVIKKPGQEDG